MEILFITPRPPHEGLGHERLPHTPTPNHNIANNMTTTRNPFLDDEDISLLGGDGDRGDGNGKRPPHPIPPSTNNNIANTMTPPNNPFDNDDLSLLSGDGNRDGLPQQVRGPSISSHVSKVAATNDDAGRTTGQRRWSEQPRPTQDRGRPLSAMRPGRSLASLLPKKNGGGGTAASASAAAPMTRSRSNGRQRSRLKLRLPHLSSGDDVSVTDSICDIDCITQLHTQSDVHYI